MTGIAVPLGEGIHRISLALPPLGPKTVNCYAVEGGDGLTLIDCGVNTRRELDVLLEGLRQVGGDEAALRRLICTHLHFDHMGGAAALLSDHPAEFVMHTSVTGLVDWYNDRDGHREYLVQLVREHGGPSRETALMGAVWQRRSFRGYAVPPSRPVGDGDRIELGGGRYLEVIHAPGHDRTHICLVDSRTGHLFAGDHILPRITPFVPYDPDRDALGDYLESLERIVELDPPRTLPGHGESLDGGGERALQIMEHHEERLRVVAKAATGQTTDAWGVMNEVFGAGLDPVSSVLALLETLSHLEHLARTGRLAKRFEEGLPHYG
ncbi:MAG: MBL fold metallo-hydrolase [bacterium]|nr:MBL fold metallo-hydrolase [bacterium]MDE0287181.1 MBL fold metallo-hydrolase [bacterium]MDE0437164.1 MBL fold metallo-hydrolase [bacterium]